MAFGGLTGELTCIQMATREIMPHDDILVRLPNIHMLEPDSMDNHIYIYIHIRNRYIIEEMTRELTELRIWKILQ